MDWSSNGKKLAIANADRIILLFDETGKRRDKFATKPIDAKVCNSLCASFVPNSLPQIVLRNDGSQNEEIQALHRQPREKEIRI